MDHKDIPLQPDTVRDHSEDMLPLGPVVMNLPEGEALCHDAVSCTAITGQHEGGDKFIAIVTVADFEGMRLGVLTQFTPASARMFAASLIGSADQIDGGEVTN